MTILESLPSYVPKDSIRHTETRTVVTEKNDDGELETKTVYTLSKAPFNSLRSVTAIVAGVEQKLTVGSDVVAIDTNDDGEFDSIEFEETIPDRDTEFTVTYKTQPTIVQYVDPYDSDIQHNDGQLDTIFDARAFDNAKGKQLDLLGGMFGDVGNRSGRDDTEYRAFLKSVVQAFSATGTKDDIRFVTSGALGVDLDSITINEDFDAVGFTVSVTDDNAVFVESVNELIRRASPSGVSLLRPPVLVTSRGVVVLSGVETEVSVVAVGLDAGELNDGSLS